MQNKWVKVIAMTSAAAAISMLTGCRVDTHKNGDNEDVKIATPFGGMSVKTNEAVVEGGVGMTIYPGAVVVKKGKEEDTGAADVSMNFGSFHLGVKVVSYKTPDSPDKLLDFYRKDMSKFGVVILCRGHHAIGTPTRTQDGLSCEKDGQTNVQTDEGTSGELKAGSKQHQHIVVIDPDGSGSKFGLIALDLPGHFTDDDTDHKQ